MAREVQEKRAFFIKKKSYKFEVDLTLKELAGVGGEEPCCVETEVSMGVYSLTRVWTQVDGRS